MEKTYWIEWEDSITGRQFRHIVTTRDLGQYLQEMRRGGHSLVLCEEYIPGSYGVVLEVA